jgi:hypothetical protein
MTEPTITDEELARIAKWVDATYPSYMSTWPGRLLHRLIAALRAGRQRLATVRALHPRGPDGLCPRCRVDWPCETAEAVGE